MTAFFIIVWDTFRSLRRDRIFIPAFVVGVAFVFLGYLASSWVFEDQQKIMQDILAFALMVVGYFVAISWGVGLIHQGRFSASNEIQLVAPIQRWVWLIGRYLGLILALAFIELVIVGVWTLTQYVLYHAFLSLELLWMFAMHFLAWGIGAAMALMLSVFCRRTLALFASLALLFCGLLGKSLSSNLGPDVLPIVETTAKWLGDVWNLSRYSVVAYEPLYEAASFLYGICLIGMMLTSASWFFERKDF